MRMDMDVVLFDIVRHLADQINALKFGGTKCKSWIDLESRIEGYATNMYSIMKNEFDYSTDIISDEFCDKFHRQLGLIGAITGGFNKWQKMLTSIFFSGKNLIGKDLSKITGMTPMNMNGVVFKKSKEVTSEKRVRIISDDFMEINEKIIPEKSLKSFLEDFFKKEVLILEDDREWRVGEYSGYFIKTF